MDIGTFPDGLMSFMVAGYAIKTLFTGPDTPDVPEVKDTSDEEIKAKRKEERAAQRRRQGYGSTILTSDVGDTGVEKKTLLGT